MASFITRAVILLSGYVYPAYECFKTVEKVRPPDVKQLQFWCQYWMIIAVLTVLERLGDAFISWLPMYSEAKLAFIVYLWYPKTQGTTYVYKTFLRPLVANHELEIDRHLNEFRTRAGDMAFQYWQRGSAYAQSRFLEILQFLAAQSAAPAPAPAPAQAQAPVHAPLPTQVPPQVWEPPPTVYQQAYPVDQEVHSVPQPERQANQDFRPSAPVMPPGFDSQPQFSLPPHDHHLQQSSYSSNEDSVDAPRVPPVPEPRLDIPVQRTRSSSSRQRSRKYQP